MIKFLIAFDAASDLSREQSHSHYRDRHAPLVSGVPEFWRHVRGYVQNFALEDVAGGTPQPGGGKDGVSELWFDDWDSYDVAFAEPLYLERIRPDELRFADFTSLIVVFARDARIFGGPETPANKLLRFIRRAPGVSADGFREHWETRHAAEVAADPMVRRLASGYVQNRPLWRDDLAFQPSDAIDGVDEYGFASRGDLERFLEAERRSGTGPLRGIDVSVTDICTSTRIVGNVSPP